MPVFYLGYNDLDFTSADGKTIDGIKVYWYFESDSQNYFGYEIGSYFIPRGKSEIIKQIKNLVPGEQCELDLRYNGKKPVFVSLTPIK